MADSEDGYSWQVGTLKHYSLYNLVKGLSLASILQISTNYAFF